MKIFVFILMVFYMAPVSGWSQPHYLEYSGADVKPQFPGGDSGIRKYLSQNLRYPLKAKEAKIQGIVLVRFVVYADGKVKDIEIEKSVNELLDAEAIRLVEAMPPWKPGEYEGKPTNVQYILPVRFSIK